MKHENIRSLYIVSKSPNAGSMLVTLGLAELLLRRGVRLAFFRPLIPDIMQIDADTDTILTHFSLQQSYDEAVGMRISEAEHLLSQGRMDTLIKTLLEQHAALIEAYDFVLCAGTASDELAQLIDFDLNVELAKNFEAPVVGVVSATRENAHTLNETMQLWRRTLTNQGASLFMLLANRCDAGLYKTEGISESIEQAINVPVALLPNIRSLDRPNVSQIVKALGAEVLIGDELQLQRIIGEPRIAAMHLEHFLSRIKPDDFIIVPADRSDIILGAMVANFAENFPSVSAILLTGDLSLPADILKLVKGLPALHIPLIHLRQDTIETTALVNMLPSRIDYNTPKKIATALGVFNENVPTEAIVDRIATSYSDILTPAVFEHRLFARAATQVKSIVLPESNDDRILRAADIILRRRCVDIVLLGKNRAIMTKAASLGLHLKRARIVDPDDHDLRHRLAEAYQIHRSHKGLNFEAALDALNNTTLFATMLVDIGLCDGMVSGATHTTRETILPALQTIKTREGSTIVSSCFFMCFDTRVLVYADCAVNPDPDAAQLAEIAVASADTATQFGIEPRIAMLSYSTGSSGVGSDVDKVREATAIVRQRRPELAVDGPMQYDAAIDPSVGASKMPGSPVAGQATVFIFPDLNTGNNTYKAVQRSADAVAVGPVLQGLAKPVNDLSRGALVDDIVNTIAITAIQAQEVSP